MQLKFTYVLLIIVILATGLYTIRFNQIVAPQKVKIVNESEEYLMGWGNVGATSFPLIYQGELYLLLEEINKFTTLDCEYDIEMNIVKIKKDFFKSYYESPKVQKVRFVMDEESGKKNRNMILSGVSINTDIETVSDIGSFFSSDEEELGWTVLTTKDGVYLPVTSVCELIGAKTSWNRFTNEFEISTDAEYRLVSVKDYEIEFVVVNSLNIHLWVDASQMNDYQISLYKGEEKICTDKIIQHYIRIPEQELDMFMPHESYAISVDVRKYIKGNGTYDFELNLLARGVGQDSSLKGTIKIKNND